MSTDTPRFRNVLHGLLIVLAAVGLLVCGLIGMDGAAQNLTDWEGSLWVVATALSFALAARVLHTR